MCQAQYHSQFQASGIRWGSWNVSPADEGTTVLSAVIPDSFFFFPKQNCIDEIETIISVKLQLIGIVGIGIAGLTVREFQNTSFFSL